MNATERLGLPFILPGQAQKELFHNEALQTIDVVIAGAVEEPPRQTPPLAPLAGQCFLVDDNATGEWASHIGSIAAFTSAGWRFVAAIEGMRVYVRSAGAYACYRDGAWEVGLIRGSSIIIAGNQVIGPRAEAISEPVGGAQTDPEARAAIAAILITLRNHGLIDP